MITFELTGWRAAFLLAFTFIGMLDVAVAIGYGIHLGIKHFM